MKFVVRVLLEWGDGTEAVLAVAEFQRDGSLQGAKLGLSLAESKTLLTATQRALVEQQFQAHWLAERHCKNCGRPRSIKDYHTAQFRSLFSTVALRVPRLNGCRCGASSSVQSMTLQDLPNWIAPELEYVQARLAASLPYDRSADVLRLLMPVGKGNTSGTVRHRAIAVGERLESEPPIALTPEQSKASTTIALGLDGGFVRHSDPKQGQSFEIVVGRLYSAVNVSSRIGFVRTHETKKETHERLRRWIKTDTSNEVTVSVFTDGEIGLRQLQLSVWPEASHVLDWYHLTRKITGLSRILHSRATVKDFPVDLHTCLAKRLTSMKWRVWHGRPTGGLDRLRSFLLILQRRALYRKPVAKRLRQLGKELQTYLENNVDSIINYAKRYRLGERISTAFVESTVNLLIDKRMSKSQQMRWSPNGAHALLQVRVEVVDQRLGEAFTRWYPGFQDPEAIAA